MYGKFNYIQYVKKREFYYWPPNAPKVTIKTSIFGLNVERIKAIVDIILPAIVTLLHPNLLAKALTIGPIM